jgi:VCBS repeat-containing protein
VNLRRVKFTAAVLLLISPLIFVPTVAHANTGGSMSFAGTASSFLSINSDTDLQFGTGDFTIEWWQFQTDTNSWPRVFSMGNYPAAIGVSIEGGSFYYWNGNARYIANLTGYKNTWSHFAIARQGTTLRVFRDGTQIGSNLTDSTNYLPTSALVIGNELTKSVGAAFGGRITNFHWLKGTAKYTSSFTAPQSPIVAQTGSNLLLNSSASATFASDSSGKSKAVSNTGVTWSADTPYTSDSTPPNVLSVSSNTANGSYKTGTVIDLRVTFSENVTVTGTPQLTLETGSIDRVVNYSSGSGTSVLVFNYTIQSGDTTNDLDYVANNSLTLNSGTIRDAASNNATLTLPSPGASGSLGNSKSLIIDTTAPTITGPSSATGATSSISIPETATAVHTFTANESVTWSKSGTDGSFFTISSGGALTITARNFESPADSGGDNTYVVVITATDGAANATSQTLTVTITNVNEAPTITINSSNETHTITQAENISSVVTYTATDVDTATTLSWSLSGTDAADFSINSSSGVLAFASNPDFEAPADSDTNNVYTVVITVSDGSLTDTQTLTVTITNANESASINAPTVSGTINKGIATTITVTINVAGKVRFFVGGKRISTCKDRTTSGTYPNNSATCSWRPAVTGRQILTATLTPTDNTFSASTSAPTTVQVVRRGTTR